MSNIIYKELSDKIIGGWSQAKLAARPCSRCAITVHKIIGPGFLENVYEQSLCVELKLNDIPFKCQKIYSVFFKGFVVGKYLTDIVVDNKIILELKSVPFINRNMEAAPAHPCARGICPSMDSSSAFKLSSCFKSTCRLCY